VWIFGVGGQRGSWLVVVKQGEQVEWLGRGRKAVCKFSREEQRVRLKRAGFEKQDKERQKPRQIHLTKTKQPVHDKTSMGIVCSTDDTAADAKAPSNPYGFPSAAHPNDQTIMEQRNEVARLQRIEDRALREAMRASARTASQENIDNKDVFATSSDV
jgi:hypothetical protein